ncbi:MAG: hypothetical protein WCR12_07900 [Dysgonamonadaceae bacterium]
MARELVRLLFPFKEVVHTITADNGCEFAEHEYSTHTRCGVLFCPFLFFLGKGFERVHEQADQAIHT